MRPCPIPSRTRGISLVETVAVMAAGAVLMSVAIAMYVAVIRSDRKFAVRLDAQQSLTELTGRLRSDVHAAMKGTWDDATDTLRLESSDGGRVEYAFKPARCERREAATGDEETRLSGAYRLPPRTEWSVSLDQLNQHMLVTAEFTGPRPGARRDSARQQTEVTAIVGRDSEILYP